METILKIPKIRTPKEVVLEIKKIDPDTAVTEFLVRQEAKKDTDKIFTVMSGRKILINLEKFVEYLNELYKNTVQTPPNNKHGMTPIKP